MFTWIDRFHTWRRESFARPAIGVTAFAKNVFLLLTIALICQSCARHLHQEFSNDNGHYKVDWLNAKISRIQYKDKINLSHNFLINIGRHGNMETVKINSRRDLVWADDVLTPSEEGGTVIGIICGEIGSDPATRYWKLESDGFLIYKEIISDDANHGLQHTDFFGPGGISLEPNRKVSN